MSVLRPDQKPRLIQMRSLRYSWSGLLTLSLCFAACDDGESEFQQSDGGDAGVPLVPDSMDAGKTVDTQDAAKSGDATWAAADASRLAVDAGLACIPPRIEIVERPDVMCDVVSVGTQVGSPERTRQQTDEIYASMKPVTYVPPSDRWQYLERTREILCCRGSLLVSMVGDSIIADTGRSRWDDYLAELTGARITKLVSVGNGLGAMYFQQEPNTWCAAVRQRPDLVILGGISQVDSEATRQIIRQIRQYSNSDILLLTPAFGLRDPSDPAAWSYQVDAQIDPQRAALVVVANEEKVGLLDMTGEWGKYVNDSGQKVEAFKRDIVHANPEGEQIEGRILLNHLTPNLGGTSCGD